MDGGWLGLGGGGGGFAKCFFWDGVLWFLGCLGILLKFSGSGTCKIRSGAKNHAQKWDFHRNPNLGNPFRDHFLLFPCTPKTPFTKPPFMHKEPSDRERMETHFQI